MHNKRKSRLGKIKASGMMTAVLLVGSVIAGAAILGFFFSSTTTVTTEELFLIDDVAPEEYELTNTITNAVGGNVYTFEHYLNSSLNMQNNVTLCFDWSGNTSSDGITPELLYLGNPITELVIEPGTSYLITERLTLDPMITSDVYTCVLTVTAT